MKVVWRSVNFSCLVNIPMRLYLILQTDDSAEINCVSFTMLDIASFIEAPFVEFAVEKFKYTMGELPTVEFR